VASEMAFADEIRQDRLIQSRGKNVSGVSGGGKCA
jgi:hypothetical protein